MNHLIQRQILDIRLEQNNRPVEQQQAIRSLYWDRILPAMDKVFSQIAPKDAVLRLDQLTLDIGTVTIDNLEEEIIGQVTQQLKETFVNIAQKSSQNPAKHSKAEHVSKLIKQEDSAWKALRYFLEHGLFPWWFTASKMHTPQTLLEKVQKEQAGRIIHWIQEENHGIIRKRLIAQFGSEALLKLLETNQPQASKVLRQIQEILVSIETPQNISGNKWAHAIEKAIKESIILGLVEGKNSGVISDKKIVGYFVAQLTRHLNIALDKLLLFLNKTLIEDDGKQGKKARAISKEAFAILKKVLKTNLRESEITNKRKGSIDQNKENGAKSKSDQDKNAIVPESIKGETPISSESSDAQREEPMPSSVSDDLIKTVISGENSSHSDQTEIIEAAMEEGIYIENAGIILIAPFLKMYFEKMGLTADQKFITTEKQERALHLIHYLSTGETTIPEEKTILNKLLVGWSLEEPIAATFELSEAEIQESNGLLQAVLQHWGALGNSGIDALRETFFLREGKLIEKEAQYKLIIERKTIDILLDKIPWSFGIIKFPWMENKLSVEW